jgi:hypothetical protein
MISNSGYSAFMMAKTAMEQRGKIAESIKKHGSDATLSEVPAGIQAWLQMIQRSPPSLRDTMPSAMDQFDRIAKLYVPGAQLVEFDRAYAALQDRIEDDLKRLQYYGVPKELVPYYNDPTPFGAAVADRFHAAIDDIEEASKCLALGRATAVVLHLVRVMEVGLKALAAVKPLAIEYAPSWESYLRLIQKKIDESHKDKPREWTKIEPFLRDISGDLLTVKQAWRNPTMHVDRKYAPEEAGEIFIAVRRFMQRLADGLPN